MGPQEPASAIANEFPLIGHATELDQLYRLFGDMPEVEPSAMLKGDGGDDGTWSA